MSKTITKFDKSNIRAIQDDVRKALSAVADKYGIKLERKGYTYSPDHLPMGYRFITVETSEDGEVLDSAAKDLDRYAYRHGLGEGLYGREFTNGVDTFRVCGYKPKSHKYPFIAENVKSGKKYKFAAQTVKRGLEAAA